MTMRFLPAIKLAFQRFRDVEGRSSRAEFWWYALFFAGLNGILQAEDTLGGLALLVTAIPFLAVSVRRLHDTGRSGMWLLLGVIPLIGHLILLFWFGQRGERRRNEYGDDPLDEGFRVEVID